jgi:hypothetical protein
VHAGGDGRKLGRVGRLDEEKLATLRGWAEGLSQDERDEVRAAGRAITILLDEVEQLNVELWHARELKEPEPPASEEPAPTEELAPAPAPARPSLRAALLERLHRSPRGEVASED